MYKAISSGLLLRPIRSAHVFLSSKLLISPQLQTVRYASRMRDYQRNMMRPTRGQQQQQQHKVYDAEEIYEEDGNGPEHINFELHPSLIQILNEPRIVLERKIEYFNVFMSFEQGNKYVLMNTYGEQIGFCEERMVGFGKVLLRQILRTRRPYILDLYDNNGDLIMSLKRGFKLINSHVKVIIPTSYDQREPNGKIIGECIQAFHLWRMKYDLFERVGSTNRDSFTFKQFGTINSFFVSVFLSRIFPNLFPMDFPVFNEANKIISSISRSFVGLIREMFTDTGIYVVSMNKQDLINRYAADANGMEVDQYIDLSKKLTLNERSILLGNCLSIDFDFFSRHSTNQPSEV